MNPAEIRFTGDSQIALSGTLLDFWRWAFSDLSDDDIKGIFAEWMVRILLGLPLADSRRVSWANSDIILGNGTRIEVKASALWQSWKLVDENGTPISPVPAPVPLIPKKIRFSSLQARTATRPTIATDYIQFKSDFYIFCFHSQTNPSLWDAWNLADWEFYMMSRQELAELKRKSISLTRLRKLKDFEPRGMSAAQFRSYAKSRLGMAQNVVSA
jgi:hypothetical protein